MRRRTSRPFVLDEVIDGSACSFAALADDAMDIINLKISKVGGLTKARLMRDLCVASGIANDDRRHLGRRHRHRDDRPSRAQSTPEEFCFSATDFNSYGTLDIAAGAPKRVEGFMTASDRPGLGIEPNFAVLGDPVFTIG